MARISYINSDLQLQLTESQLTEIKRLSDFREMKSLMVQFAHENSVEISEQEIQTSNNSVTGQFDDKFYLDEGSKELLKFLTKKRINVGIISTRGNQSLKRVVNTIHQIGDNVDILL
ncbi:hypothetical protein FACS1894176_09840 [Bacteroidia bacterium]|nr:hypothetical protein FACS1894176_09840 [Bacteroidia bacterium]